MFHNFAILSTNVANSLHALLVKYYNDLLGWQNSERDMDEVTFFYVGDLFCIHLDTKTEFMCFILFANRFLNKVLNGIKTFYPVREQVSQRCYCFLFCWKTFLFHWEPCWETLLVNRINTWTVPITMLDNLVMKPCWRKSDKFIISFLFKELFNAFI